HVLEGGAGGGGRLGAPLGVEAAGEAEQRPAVGRVPLEVLAVDPLGGPGLAGLEQDRAEVVAPRDVPVRRLHVRQVVLQPNRGPERAGRVAQAPLGARDGAGQHAVGDAELTAAVEGGHVEAGGALVGGDAGQLGRLAAGGGGAAGRRVG